MISDSEGAAKRSKNEELKESSKYLRGTLLESLNDP